MAVKKYKPTKEEIEYGEFVKDLPEKDFGKPWYEKVPKKIAQEIGRTGVSVGRGLAKGTVDFGRALGPLEPTFEEELNRLKTGKEIPSKTVEFAEILDEFLPPSEKSIQQGLERGSQIFPFLATGGGNTLTNILRSAGAGLTGQAIESAGGGPVAQTIGEVGATLSIPSIQKQIPARTAKESQRLQKARELGVREEELALSLGKEGKTQSIIEKSAAKGPIFQKKLEESRQRLGQIYNTLRERPGAQFPIPEKVTSKTLNTISDKISKMPAEIQEAIQKDYQQFLQTEMTPANVMDFWKKLQFYITNKNYRQVGLLKEDLADAISEVNPFLAEDFTLTNKLYENFSKQKSRLNPNLFDSFITFGEAGSLLYGIVTGNYPMIATTTSFLAARNLASQLLTNPRLQNLAQRFKQGIQQNLPNASKKAYNQMILELGKEVPEAAQQLSGIEIEEFLSILKEEDRNQSKK